MDETNALTRLKGLGGWRAERRATPLLGHAVGAGGGVLVALGVIAIGVDQVEDEGSGGLGAFLCAVLVAVALVAMTRVPGPARSAAVAAVVIGVVGTWFFLLTVDSDDGSTTAAQGLVALTFFVLFVVGPARGRAVLLGLALLFTWTLITGEVADDGGTAATEFDTGSSDDPFDDAVPDPFDEPETNSGVVSLVFGAAYLAAAWGLDRRRLHGVATPFVAVGITAAVVGAFIVGADAGAVGGGLLAVGVGGAVGWVGAQGRHRRASVWLGTATAVIGITVVVNEIAEVDDSALGFAALAIILGAAIVVGSVFLGRLIGEPADEQAEAAVPGE